MQVKVELDEIENRETLEKNQWNQRWFFEKNQ